ncbi:glycoside hydrolase family 47 protein [Xylariaceae sp. FL0255]|nr:glycoside hydrolase family 47 protein [Xylariaceae sp. FL0255]
MVRSSLALAALSAVSSVTAVNYVSHPDRTAAVAAAFQRSWDGYYKYAFPNDTLLPISLGSINDRNGWGASAVDAISTALVMGKNDIVQIIVDHIKTVNYTETAPGATDVSVFETTIRYLGGMLSAYDFLNGPFKGAVSSNDTSVLLTQSKNLADALKVTFDTPTGIPINDLIFNGPNGPAQSNETTNGIATIGTLVLEWTHLSDLLGDASYGQLAQKGESYLINVTNPEVGEPYPGMLGTNVYVANGTFADGSGGWNGGDDSFYEYLIKMYVYDSSRFGTYKDRWVMAVESTMKYLKSHPSTTPEFTYVAAYNGAGQENLLFESSHLACFNGGNIILGGLTLNRPDFVNFGLALVNGCHETYNSTVTHIGPEAFSWQDSKLSPNASNNGGAPSDQAAFYAEHGFWITAADYIERPEVIESYYYAYRATGDTKYQDWAWDAFQHINSTCAAGVGYSGITNVNAAGGGSFDDQQQTFWFAEVLKYSYLIQAPDAEYQVNANHDNQWVFNTECHPVKVAGTPT